MADILIKNMNNKPKNCILEEHLSDGTVIKHEVVELPPHGELIERSKVHEAVTQAYCLDDVPSIIDQLVPTVVEAST